MEGYVTTIPVEPVAATRDGALEPEKSSGGTSASSHVPYSPRMKLVIWTLALTLPWAALTLLIRWMVA